MMAALLSSNPLVLINIVALCQAQLVLESLMGDRLRAGEPSRYVASYLGQLSLPSLRGR